MLQQDIEAYIKSYDFYYTIKTVRYKPNNDLQLLFIPTYW